MKCEISCEILSGYNTILDWEKVEKNLIICVTV